MNYLNLIVLIICKCIFQYSIAITNFVIPLSLSLSLSLSVSVSVSLSLCLSLSSHFYPLVNGCWIFNYITIAIHTKLCTTQLPKHHAAILIPQIVIVTFQNLPAQLFLSSAPVCIVLMNSVLLASLSMVHRISVSVTLKLEIICSLF